MLSDRIVGCFDVKADTAESIEEAINRELEKLNSDVDEVVSITSVPGTINLTRIFFKKRPPRKGRPPTPRESADSM